MPPTATGSSDHALVQRVLASERSALEEFGRRMRCVELILAAQNIRLGRSLDEGEVQDLAQDTILKVWSKLHTFEGLATLETWVYKFCALELMNALRVKRRRARAAASDPGLDEVESPQARAIVDVERLNRAFERLSPMQADVIRMRHFEELDFDLMAVRLSMPLNTVRAHYQRGIKELKYLLAGRKDEMQ